MMKSSVARAAAPVGVRNAPFSKAPAGRLGHRFIRTFRRKDYRWGQKGINKQGILADIYRNLFIGVQLKFEYI
jgi:hypothetical protein